MEGATRANGKNERSDFEGEAPAALPVEGATRANGKNERSDFEGEAPAGYCRWRGRREPTARTSGATLRGRLRQALPVEGATRANGKNERSDFEGEAPAALPVEGATRADNKNERSDFEGEAPAALPVEGATRAPVIAGCIALSDLARRQFRFAVEDSLSMARFLAKTLTVPVALLDCPWNRADPGSLLVTRFLDWRSLGRAAADGSL